MILFLQVVVLSYQFNLMNQGYHPCPEAAATLLAVLAKSC